MQCSVGCFHRGCEFSSRQRPAENLDKEGGGSGVAPACGEGLLVVRVWVWVGVCCLCHSCLSAPVSSAHSRPLLPPPSQLPGGRGSVSGAAAAALLRSVWQQSARRSGGLGRLLQRHRCLLSPCGCQFWTGRSTVKIIHEEEQERRKGEGEGGYTSSSCLGDEGVVFLGSTRVILVDVY